MQDNKKVILVVEDEIPLQQAAKTMLERNGVNVVTAQTVEQAKEYIQKLPRVDVIWLDHYLIGKENGLDFMAWCKSNTNAKYSHIPFYVVTNTASLDKMATYLRLGAKEYFVKSDHSLNDIIKTIINSLGSHAAQPAY